MKKLLFFILLISSLTSFSQNIVGKWKSVDDKRNIETAIMEIYEENGIYKTKIIAILNKENAEKCTNCVGKYHNKNLVNLILSDNLIFDEKVYNGKILDPESNKIYSCYMELINNDKLKIRGYIGFSLLGRTQYWYRVNEKEAKILIDKVN